MPVLAIREKPSFEEKTRFRGLLRISVFNEIWGYTDTAWGDDDVVEVHQRVFLFFAFFVSVSDADALGAFAEVRAKIIND